MPPKLSVVRVLIDTEQCTIFLVLLLSTGIHRLRLQAVIGNKTCTTGKLNVSLLPPVVLQLAKNEHNSLAVLKAPVCQVQNAPTKHDGHHEGMYLALDKQIATGAERQVSWRVGSGFGYRASSRLLHCARDHCPLSSLPGGSIVALHRSLTFATCASALATWSSHSQPQSQSSVTLEASEARRCPRRLLSPQLRSFGVLTIVTLSVKHFERTSETVEQPSIERRLF